MTLDIKAARALCDAATPGPWGAHNRQTHLGAAAADGAFWTVDGPNGNSLIEPQANRPANAAFIAAARTGWPAALDRVEELEREVEALRVDLRCAEIQVVDRGNSYRQLRGDVAEALDMGRDAKPENVIATIRAFNERNDRHVATEDALIAERDAARAEVERMRPVVEAAEKWHDMERSSYSSSADYAAEEAGASRTLLDAVDAFRAVKP